MNKVKGSIALVAVAAISGVIFPSTANAARFGNATPSCAAYFANYERPSWGPLGIAQRNLWSGFAKFIAQSRLGDNNGYCSNG